MNTKNSQITHGVSRIGKVGRILSACLSLIIICCYTPVGYSQFYDNSDQIVDGINSIGVETFGDAFGNEILVPSGSSYNISRARILYAGQDVAPGDVATVELYSNDGESGRPGTLLATQPGIALNDYPTVSKYTNESGDIYLQELWVNFDPPISVNANFTVTVRFTSAGVEFPTFRKPTSGLDSYNDFWVKSGNDWALKKIGGAGLGSRIGISLWQENETELPALSSPLPPLTRTAEQGSLTLTATASGNALQYQWFKNETLLEDQIRNVLVFVELDENDVGIYRVRVFNDKGEVTSSDAEVAIAANAPKIVSSSGDGSFVALDETAFFSVTASGQNNKYEWFRNGTLIDGANATSYSTQVTSSTYNDAFEVKVSNSVGSVTRSFSVNRVVRERVVLPERTVVDGNGRFSIPIISLVRSNTGLNVPDSASVSWNFYSHNNLNTSSSVFNSDRFNLLIENPVSSDSGIYEAFVSWGTSSVQYQVSLVQRLFVRLIPPAITQQPQKETLVKSGAPVSIQAFVDPGQYSFTESIFPREVKSATATLNDLIFIWKNGDEVVASGRGNHILDIPSVDSSMSGHYDFEVYKSINGIESDSTRSSTFSIVVSDGLVISTHPQDVSSAIGNSAQLSVEVDGVPESQLRFQWFRNGEPLVGATGIQLTFSNLNNSDAGRYQVRVSADFDTIFSAFADVEVISPPIITRHPTISGLPAFEQEVFVNPGQSFVQILGFASNAAQYQWFSGRNPIPDSNSSSIRIAVSNLPAVITMIASNQAGNSQSLPLNIKLKSRPVIIDIGTERLTRLLVGQTLSVSPRVSGEVESYEWTFNGQTVGNTQTLQKSSLNLDDAGNYQLKVSNEAGFSTRTFSLVVDSSPIVNDIFFLRDGGSDPIRFGDGGGTELILSGSESRIRFRWDVDGSTPLILSRSLLKDDGTPVSVLDSQIPTVGGQTIQVNSPGLYQFTSEFSNAFGIASVQDITIRKGDQPELRIDNMKQSGNGNYLLFTDGIPARIDTRTGNSFDRSVFPINVVLSGNGAISGTATFTEFGRGQLWSGTASSEMSGLVSMESSSTLGNHADLGQIIVVNPIGDGTTLATSSFEYEVVLGQPLTIGLEFEDVGAFSENVQFLWSNGGSTSPQLTFPSLEAGDLKSYSLRIMNSTGEVVLGSYTFFLRPELNPIGFTDTFVDRGVINPQNETSGFGVIASQDTTLDDFEPFHDQGIQFSTMWSTFTTGVNGGILRIQERTGKFVAVYQDAPTFSGLTRIGATRRNQPMEVAVDANSVYAIVFGDQYRRYSHTRPSILEWSFTEVEKPIQITQQPANAFASEGESVEFSITTNGDNEFGFQWFLNGTPIDEATGTTLTLPSVSTDDIGQYSVRVRSQASGQEVDSQTVSLQLTPSSTFAGSFSFAGAQSAGAGIGFRAGVRTVAQEFFETSAVFSNFGFGREPGEPDHCGVIGGSSVWLPYTAPISGNLILNTNGSEIDTVLAVYSAEVDNPTFDDLIEESCDDNGGADGIDSQLHMEVTAGKRYFLVVDGKAAAIGIIRLNLQIAGELDVAILPSGNITAELGSSVTLNAFVDTPAGSPSYQWFKSGEIIDGATGSQLTLTEISRADTGSYTVEISAAGNDTLSSATIINVGPSIAHHPEPKTIIDGRPVTLSVVAQSSATLNFQWLRNGTPVSGGITQTLTVNQPGQYAVRVSDSFGSITSNSVAVDESVPLSFTSIPLESQSVIIGNNLTLQFDFQGPQGTSIQWLKDGDVIPSETSNILNFTPFTSPDTGSYLARLTTGDGRILESPEFEITAIGLPVIIDQSSDLDVALGAGFTLSSSAVINGSGTYSWFFNGSELAGESQPQLTIENAAVEDDGVYHFTVANGAGSVTSQPIIVKVITPPVILTHPADVAGTLGGTAAFTVDVNGFEPITYQWLRNGIAIEGATGSTHAIRNLTAGDIGSYSVRISNFGGVTNSRSASLLLELPVEIVSQPTPINVAAGNQAILEVQISGAGNVRYQWFKNGVKIDGANQRQFIIENTKVVDTGFYSVEVSNSINSVGSTASLLEIFIAPDVLVQSRDTTLYEGDSIQLFAKAIGSGPLTYDWFYDGELIQSSSNPILLLEDVIFEDSGFYRVTVSNPVGSAEGTNINISVVDRFRTQFSIFQPELLPGQVNMVLFEAFPDFSYNLESSKDLSSWGNGILLENLRGQVIVADQTADQDLHMFYRVGTNHNPDRAEKVSLPGEFVSSALVLEDGSSIITLEFNGLNPGVHNQIQVSSDLINWVPLVEELPSVEDLTLVHKLGGTADNTYFYRVVEISNQGE